MGGEEVEGDHQESRYLICVSLIPWVLEMGGELMKVGRGRFTNVMSQNWYSMRSYDHFCFFSQIDNSKKKKDE